MKKLLIIILIWMGVFILLRPVGEFKGEAVGNIVYRKNLVTGIITADNGDKSYAVEIGESGKSIKKIFTLSPDPDLKVGDKARVLHRGGNKEDMILLASTKPAVVPPAIEYYIAYLNYSGSTHYLTILDLDGNVIYNGIHSATAFSTNNDPLTVDSDNNIYIAGRWADRIKKMDIEGNELGIYYHNNPYQIAINSNGHIWSYGWPTDNYLTKIDPDTLQEIDSILINYGDFSGMAFDSDGYLYMVDWSNKNIEKWNVISKTRVASRALAGGAEDKSIFSSLAVVGSVVYLTQWANKLGDIFTCPTALNSDFVANNVDEDFPAERDWVNFITASRGTHIIVEGYVSNIKIIVKYDTSFNRIWKITMDYETYPGTSLGIAAWPF